MYQISGYSMLAVTVTTFMLSVVFLIISYQSKKRHMQFWGISWLLYSLMFLFDFLNMQVDIVPEHYILVRQIVALAGSYIFMHGTHYFFQINPPRYFSVITAVSLLLIVLSFPFATLYALAIVPNIICASGLLVFCGCMFISYSWTQNLPEKILAGFLIILWGVFINQFSLAIRYTELAIFTYFISILTVNLLILVLIIIYFKKTRFLDSKQTERFRLLVENSSDSMFLYDYKQAAFEYVSPTIVDLIGVTNMQLYDSPSCFFDHITIGRKDRNILRLFTAPITSPGKGVLQMNGSAASDTVAAPGAVAGASGEDGAGSAVMGCSAGADSAGSAVMGGSAGADGAGSAVMGGGAGAGSGTGGAAVAWSEIHYLPIKDATGSVIAVEGILRDITENKHMEEDLSEVEDAKKQLLENISHELKTPVTLIRGYTESLLDQVVPPESAETYLHMIKSKTMLLSTLMDDLAQVSNFTSQSLEYHFYEESAAEIFEKLVRPFEFQITESGHRAKISSTIRLDAIVIVDPFRLQQVISNLVNNSIRHTPEGKEVAIRCATLYNDRLSKSAGARAGADDTGNGDYTIPQGEFIIWIRDQGDGIAEENLPHIFERNFSEGKRLEASNENPNMATGDPSLSGLGLFISREIIRQHSGDIRATNLPEGGAEITFSIPFYT